MTNKNRHISDKAVLPEKTWGFLLQKKGRGGQAHIKKIKDCYRLPWTMQYNL